MISGQTSGKFSSEFFISVLGMLGGVLCAMFSESQYAIIGGPILAAICGASYSQSRATVKRALLAKQAAAEVAAVRSTWQRLSSRAQDRLILVLILTASGHVVLFQGLLALAKAQVYLLMLALIITSSGKRSVDSE